MKSITVRQGFAHLPSDVRLLDSPLIRQIVVLDKKVSESAELEVLFPHEERGLYRIVGENASVIEKFGKKEVEIGKVLRMVLSPPGCEEVKGQFLALYNDAHDVLLCEGKVETGMALSFSPEEDDEPEAVVWCGGSSPALVYEDRVVLCGPNSAKGEFSIESHKGFYCQSEIDGIRVLANLASHIIEKVPPAVAKAFTTLSLDAASIILSAYQKYLNADPQAEERLKSAKEENKSSFVEGIKTLIKAATAEFDTENQKFLLKAASFAKNFIPPGDFNAEEFVDTLKDLRIVNQLHVQKVAVSIIASTVA